MAVGQLVPHFVDMVETQRTIICVKVVQVVEGVQAEYRMNRISI